MRGFYKRLAVSAIILACASSAGAQQALAPWFDSDGFFNKPNVSLDLATAEMTACRAEAVRLKAARKAGGMSMTVSAFNANGSYNAGMSAAGSVVGNIFIAIQDAQYNGSIEHVEFRDCVVSMGYRHYRLDKQGREGLDKTNDRGFTSAVAAVTPSVGRLNENEKPFDYIGAGIIDTSWTNGEQAAPAATADTVPTGRGITKIQQIATGETAEPGPGYAIVVASVRQVKTGLSDYGIADFRFRRVTEGGAFADLVKEEGDTFLMEGFQGVWVRKEKRLAGNPKTPRYSTFVIPAGRYALSDISIANVCLSAPTFRAEPGDVLYLGDLTMQPMQLPLSEAFNPLGNIQSGFDRKIRETLRLGLGEDLEGARKALQADADAKGRLKKAAYENGYRTSCLGKYIGRATVAGAPEFRPDQAVAFHQSMAASVTASEGAAK